jgi:hypothetical protein
MGAVERFQKTKKVLSKRSNEKPEMQRALGALSDAELVKAWGLEKLMRRRRRVLKMIYEIARNRGLTGSPSPFPEWENDGIWSNVHARAKVKS